ncbi:hypothetical protein MMC21_001149 [Puttea exsequens]|nr:hypothetical protein [Puttea exsequens]
MALDIEVEEDIGASRYGEDRSKVFRGHQDRNGWTTMPTPEPENGDLVPVVEAVGLKAPTSNIGGAQVDGKEKVLKLSPAKLYELASPPASAAIRDTVENHGDASVDDSDSVGKSDIEGFDVPNRQRRTSRKHTERAKGRSRSRSLARSSMTLTDDTPIQIFDSTENRIRPRSSSRAISSPFLRRRISVGKTTPSSSRHARIKPAPLHLDDMKAVDDAKPSPMPPSIPVPPLSLHTYLQLEMSSQRPSPLYIHRSKTSDFPYESSRVKIDRLLNFLLLPPQLEQVLWFGALACLDAWLYSFTILPLRFVKALMILGQSWVRNLATEAQYVGRFVYAGTGRMWQRRRRRESGNGSATFISKEEPLLGRTARDYTEKTDESGLDPRPDQNIRARKNPKPRHRRTKSVPSTLSPDHKADILKGFLIILSCIILMYFDASRMYHGIRGQAAIKLYVIYNVLEVCDRLFSALGQDVLECLFSKEALERKPDGRSKVWRPFWLFMLALFYNLVHSTALFYQVITLNVAVNSYSNALLTLLMSNQFVEIKSTVFKKFEKENLFQITCADIVERFQLWLMLMIIASRNIIETGGFSLSSLSGTANGGSASAASLGSSMLPKSFTILPRWTGQVMGPFFIVLGSEMLVDWIKHAYITKFNMTKPAIYGRFLDVLAKDYYSNAFADQNLTRRLGLPVIPLACLFIRASVQTYHMFLATHMPLPLPSTATSLAEQVATSSPATTAALHHIDQVFRRALGRSTFGAGAPVLSPHSVNIWNLDDVIAFATMLVFFLVLFLALLAFKLVLGMLLLSLARKRYKGMKERESIGVHAEGRRVGGWGVVEVNEDKRRWIYMDDPEGAKKLREKEKAVQEHERKIDGDGGESFTGVYRYNMVSKRIW